MTLGHCAVAAAFMPSRANADDALVPVRAPLAPVIVDEARVIRTVVGLRPFRRNGFALYATRLAGKRLVHNYGHGGGGITLSWGCATLAADLLNGVAMRDAAVLGCGVIGLSTARILQERGFDVTIYAQALPPNTTSNIAGGQWAPTAVFRDQDVTPAFRAVFQKAAAIAYGRFELMAGPRYGVRWIDNYDLTMRPDQKGQYDTEVREGVGLFADVARIDPATTPLQRSLRSAFCDDADRAQHRIFLQCSKTSTLRADACGSSVSRTFMRWRICRTTRSLTAPALARTSSSATTTSIRYAANSPYSNRSPM